jgi:AraC-like DNA-binding protein
MLLLPHIFDILVHFFPSANSYKDGWWFYLTFSFVLYYIALTGYSNTAHSKIGFKMSVFDSKPILLLNPSLDNFNQTENVIDIDYEDYSEKKLVEIEAWKLQIENLILSEKLYQNPELSLTEVAKKLKTNTSIISKAINQGFAMNFNDFINNYRVEAVKVMFTKGEHKKSTLLGIAYDCGFNSKATFNRAFKKNTGLSPKDYLVKS